MFFKQFFMQHMFETSKSIQKGIGLQNLNIFVVIPVHVVLSGCWGGGGGVRY